MKISNDLLSATVSPEHNGQVIALTDLRTEVCYAGKPDTRMDVAEGGRTPTSGLQCWIKCGDEPDFNTSVLSAFAPIYGQPLKVENENGSAILLSSDYGGMRYELEWQLTEGFHPLECRIKLANIDAEQDMFQLEFFFMWSIPNEEWSRTGFFLSGIAPSFLNPFGQILFRGSDGKGDCAFWTNQEMTCGVAIHGDENTLRYFYGVQGRSFIMGSHSVKKSLPPGEALENTVSIAPLPWAVEHGWCPDCRQHIDRMSEKNMSMLQLADEIGDVHGWASPASGDIAMEERIAHLTMQYGPVEADIVRKLLEEVILPAGYNQVIFEVDRAFPYRSHPNVGTDWAWSRAEWREIIGLLKESGVEVVPQYNALGHQHESALTTAYPELSEDPQGWCLNPLHPRTIPYLCDLMSELLDVFEPKRFHVGLDEVDIPSQPQTFCVSDVCRDVDGGELFGKHVNALYEYLATQNVEMAMWADMLMYKEEHVYRHGLRTGTYRAIEHLPRDIIMMDWVYSVVPAYPGSDYLLDKGFNVIGCTWHEPQAILDFTKYALEHNLRGMCQTTWSLPNMFEVPLSCLILAGRRFQLTDPTGEAELLREAEALALNLCK